MLGESEMSETIPMDAAIYVAGHRGLVGAAILRARLAGVPSDNVAYSIFSLTALVPWTYFSSSVSASVGSLSSSFALLVLVETETRQPVTKDVGVYVAGHRLPRVPQLPMNT